MPAVPCPHAAMLILFHPDYTVGSGITPDLLTPPSLSLGRRSRARAETLTAGGEFHPALRTEMS